ncbi:MAG: amidophosphoribosyltransferase [Oscillospiraceae bacterium]|nr:amidophosphoribosyltransferase [Oscillospiraceae bacterium]
MKNKLKEECGVFGIYGTEPLAEHAATYAYYALYSLQHRGQESCGICVGDDGVMRVHKALGLVPEVFTPAVLRELGHGTMAIGHVRYSTTGAPQAVNAQPIVVHHGKGNMAIAHNGNLTNANELREEMELAGGIFHTTSDTEVIAYTITRARLTEPSIEQAVERAMYDLKGAYSLVIMSPRKLIAARDPMGFRPLCLGKLGDAYVFASESCALDSIGADFIRDIEPGEIVVAAPGTDGKHTLISIKTHCGGKNHLCVFEYVYFARQDSVIEGESVHIARKRAGRLLARSNPVDADVVIGNPDSALDAALGYAEESGIPYGMGIAKNRYVGRTFIQPTQNQRTASVAIKLSPLKATVNGKRVVLVDDSIVRGTTTKHIVHKLREAGATEVHLRISSPPFRCPCYFGTDVDSVENLIANKYSANSPGAAQISSECSADALSVNGHSVEQLIALDLGADSLGYLSVEDVKLIAEVPNADFCVGCFTGEYPVEPPQDSGKRKFERKLSEARKSTT